VPQRQAPTREPTVLAPVVRPLLSSALAAMLDDVHAHSGAVYLLAPDEPVLEMAVKAGLPRAFTAPWERVGLSAPLPVAQALRELRLIWVNGEEQMAARFPRIAVVLPYPFALAALPVATPGTVYGAIYVTWPGSRPPELAEWERERLTAACERLAWRLERVDAGNLPLGPDPGRLTTRRTAIAGGTAGSAEAARMAARLPHGLCALDLHGSISYMNPAAAEMLGVPAGALIGSPLWAAVPWLNDPMYEDRYRAALISGQVTSFVALRPPGDWLSFRLYPGSDGLSVRIARARPLAGTGHTASRPARGTARLVTISHLLNLATALTETVGVQDVVKLVADQIAPAVGCKALVILGSHGGRLHVLGHRGYPDEYVIERWHGIPLSEQIPGTHVLTTGVPAFFDSWQQLERLYPKRQGTQDGMASWAFLPLIASGRPVGTCVLAYAEPHPFPADERAVLTSLCGLIAQALERALLYDAKQQLAQGLQAALLPHSLPSLPGIEAAARYLPATLGMEIGGDFYDLVPTGVRAAAVLGDVQGHNVTAAGLMGQIRTAVRAYTTVGQPPAAVMRSTNRLLIDLGVELFASCVYLRLDPGPGRVVMARAGHPPPLLRRPDGQVRVLDLAGGPLLGIEAEASYPTSEFALPPGSVLALYTDGLIESPGVDIEDALAELGELLALYGDEPLEALADQLVRDTATAVERPDDVALLLLRAVRPV